jgi:hypothetical protein
MRPPLKIITLLFFFIPALNAHTQDKMPSKIKPDISGSFLVSFAGNAAYASFGGPGIKITTGKWSLGLHMMPSLRFWEDKPRPLITPVLGAGLLAGYKRLIIALPFYYLASEVKWKTGIGIGVKIGK